MSKNIKQKVIATLVGFFGGPLLWALGSTCRWTVIFKDQESRTGEEKYILAFWHGQQLFMPFVVKHLKKNLKIKKVDVLISGHADGRLIARAIQFFGIGSVEGSSSRGGSRAARFMAQTSETLGSGHVYAFTPDGPKGPIRKVKKGVVFLARQTGAMVLPMALQANRAWKFRSWDEMFLPKPFSHVSLIVGVPIALSNEDSEIEASAQHVESVLNQLTAECAQSCQSEISKNN